MKLFFVSIFSLLLFICISTTTIQLKADPEEELIELLLKRSAKQLKPEDAEKIEPLFKKVREFYETQENNIETLKRKTLWFLIERDGLQTLQNTSFKDGTHALYLLGLCYIHENPSKAFMKLIKANQQGHDKALKALKQRASQYPNEIFQLGGLFIDELNFEAAATCLKLVYRDPCLCLPKYLTRGFIKQLRSDFDGALALYRKSKNSHPERTAAHIDKLFKDNPQHLVTGLKDRLFLEDEIPVVEKYLLQYARTDSNLLKELKTFANESKAASYIYHSIAATQRKKKGSQITSIPSNGSPKLAERPIDGKGESVRIQRKKRVHVKNISYSADHSDSDSGKNGGNNKNLTE